MKIKQLWYKLIECVFKESLKIRDSLNNLLPKLTQKVAKDTFFNASENLSDNCKKKYLIKSLALKYFVWFILNWSLNITGWSRKIETVNVCIIIPWHNFSLFLVLFHPICQKKPWIMYSKWSTKLFVHQCSLGSQRAFKNGAKGSDFNF